MAAGLKLIIPLIVVIPGIAAFVMVNDSSIMAGLGDVAMQNMPTADQADKGLSMAIAVFAIWFKRVSFCCLGCCYCVFFGFHVKLYIHHFYHGYIQTIH